MTTYKVIDNKVISYETVVGIIDFQSRILYTTKWNVNGMTKSNTTTRHLHKVAEQYNLTINNNFSKHTHHEN